MTRGIGALGYRWAVLGLLLSSSLHAQTGSERQALGIHLQIVDACTVERPAHSAFPDRGPSRRLSPLPTVRCSSPVAPAPQVREPSDRPAGSPVDSGLRRIEVYF